MPELLPHKAVKAKAGILKDTIDRFCEEYRWTEPGLYRGDVKESEKVSGGGISNPTRNVATGDEYLNRRALVKSALRQFDEAQTVLQSAIGFLEEAQPKYQPAPKVMGIDPQQGIYKENSRKGREQRKLQLAIQAKRRAIGED